MMGAMKKRLLLHGLFLLGLFVAAVGLTILIYYLGEKEVYELGPSAETASAAVLEQMRVGHLVVDPANPSFVFFFQGVAYPLRFTSLGERLGSFLRGLVSGDFGPALMEQGSVASLFGPAFLATLLVALLSFAFALLPVVLPLPKKRVLAYVGGIGAGISLIGAICFAGLWPKPFWIILYLCAFSFFLSLFCGAFSKQTKRSRSSFACLIGIVSLAIWFLVGLAAPLPNCASLLRAAIQAGDNHTSSLAFLGMALPVVLLLGTAFAIYDLERKEKASFYRGVVLFFKETN